MQRTILTVLVCGLVTTHVWSQGQPAAPAAQAPPIETKKVEGTDNVYTFRNQNSQAMFIVTSGGVIVTDPVGTAGLKVARSTWRRSKRSRTSRSDISSTAITTSITLRAVAPSKRRVPESWLTGECWSA